MRQAGLLLLLLAAPLAGCAGGGNPNLLPPCSDSSPLRVEIVLDKERYFPAEVVNASLFLNNTGDRAVTVNYKAFELSLRSFDGHAIRSFAQEVDPTVGATKTVGAHARVVLAERWQPFRVNGLLYDPLPAGTYYTCAVLTGVDGGTLATGARAFIAERPPQPL